jgi:hypothetical protein
VTTAAQRFWAKVDKSGDCWIWTGTCKELGYGQFHYQGKTRTAHRVAWLLTHGPIPAETPCVLHHCDNPPCVRPEPGHLFLGTLGDNARDMAAKGRGSFQRPEVRRFGLDNPRGKLTDLDVAVIRGLRYLRRPRELGPAFNVTSAHIRLLWRGEQRPHVQPLTPTIASQLLLERTGHAR